MEFLRNLPTVSYPVAFAIVLGCCYASAAITTIAVAGLADALLPRLAYVFGCVLALMSLVYIVSRLFKRTDVVDMAWGLAFIVAAVSSFLVSGSGPEIGWNIQTVTSGLVLIWGLRLAYHIGKRLLSHPEDKRYVDLRRSWKGNEAVNSYARIFFVQAVLATLVSTAVIHINFAQQQTIGVLAYIGIAAWLIGFFFEAVGDAQLKKHLANKANKGKLMTSGLWKYTRHPNYFGEATMWWGVFIISLGTTYGWVGILTPAVITYLLLFISGVPMTEKAFEGRKGWKQYKARTSIFIPLPPKN